MRFLGWLVFFLLIAGAGVGGVWAYGQYAAPGPLAGSADIEIPHGGGTLGVAGQLEEAKVISNPWIFAIIARIKDANLQAGEYEFSAHVSMRDALGKIAHGLVVKRSVTVAEGLTSWQVTQLLAATPALSGTATDPPDGTLLPQTYQYKRNESRSALLTEMQNAMDKALATLWAARAPGLPITTPQDAVTLASIVEKETGVASERARVAGLFENRLRQTMPLQSDPTAIYAITKGHIQTGGEGPLGRRLTSADLEVDSPYNTYKYAGLPPGPICNPGRDAIEAVLHPETNTYLYFVASPSGGHVFATTMEEQTKNVQAWHDFRKETGK